MNLLENKLKILVEILGPYLKAGKDEYLFTCPYNQHSKKKLAVNIVLDKFHCWSCNEKSSHLFMIVKKFGSSIQQAKWPTSQGTHVDLSLYKQLRFEENNQTQHQQVELPEDFITLTSKKHTKDATRPLGYLTKRKVTEKDILIWKMGYCWKGEYEERIIIPSFNNRGHCNYFVGRAYDAFKEHLRYKNPNVSKDIIFNELFVDFDEDVILVEGIFDVFKAGTNSIPLLGSTLDTNSFVFKELIRKNPTIYMALDPDATAKELKIMSNLLEYEIELYKIILPKNKDVGALTKEQFIDLKKQAIPINNENYLSYNMKSLLQE